MTIDAPEEFHEVCEVVKTLELHHGDAKRRFRIEIVEHIRGGSSEKFGVHYYEEKDGAWQRIEAPYVAANDVETAAHQAVHWLGMRTK
ncbi:MAG TPA: hypothetical protein VK524_19755 [Polyangiaceae bacterium]|nr:hypothetical protein [Polyangiaceae bacterium]